MTAPERFSARTIESEQRRVAAVDLEPDPLDESTPPARRGRLAPLGIAALVLGAMGVIVVGYRGPPEVEASARPVPASPPAPSQINDLTPPQVSPVAYRDLSPIAAEAWNAAFPIDPRPRDLMAPYRIVAEASVDYARTVDCLTAAVHYEAATESLEGMRAVAQVVLNRVRHPAFPHTVCGVVFQGANLPTGCQFTFTCDGALDRAPAPAAWKRARQVAISALAGYVYSPVSTATHYHTRWVVPVWAPNLSKIGSVGAHVFYSWKGSWGQARAFNSVYEASEPDVAMLYGVGKAPFVTPATIETSVELEPAPIKPELAAPLRAPQIVEDIPIVLAAASPLPVAASEAATQSPAPAPQATAPRVTDPLASRPSDWRARLPMASGF